jgi:hypothetical protein
MLEQAPRNIVSAEAIPRLATVRALHEPSMVSPKANPLAASVLQPSAKPLPEQ